MRLRRNRKYINIGIVKLISTTAEPVVLINFWGIKDNLMQEEDINGTIKLL